MRFWILIAIAIIFIVLSGVSGRRSWIENQAEGYDAILYFVAAGVWALIALALIIWAYCSR